MANLSFSKKVLVIPKQEPALSGATKYFFESLFSQFDERSYFIYESTEPPAHGLTRLFRFISDFTHARRIIEEHDIEMLVGMADKGPALWLTYALALATGKPYALYLLDLYRWNHFGGLWDLLAHSVEPILFAHAHAIIVMGDGHRMLYEKKYPGKFSYVVVRNSLTARAPSPIHSPHTPPYRIVYTGGIYFAQERSIRNLIEAVKDMEDVRIELYVPRRRSVFEQEFEAYPNVSFHSAPHEDMNAVQESADILFLPLSWGTNAPEVIDMAVPGKTAEYLQSGRPILVHAPPDCFLSPYAKETGFAEVVDTEDPEKLRAAVQKLTTDATHVQALLENARALFEREYQVEKNAIIFKNAL